MNKLTTGIIIIFVLAAIVYLSPNKTEFVALNGQPSEEVMVMPKINVPEGAYLYKITEPSSVSYISVKKFFNKPEETVTGTTTLVNGDGWFNPSNGDGFVQAWVDISNFETGNAKRDEDVKMLFSDPYLRFSSNLGEAEINMVSEYNIDIPGSLTIKGVTKEVIFKVSGRITETEIQAKGTTTIKMSDFGMVPPSLVNVFTADDNIEIRFNITAERLNQ